MFKIFSIPTFGAAVCLIPIWLQPAQAAPVLAEPVDLAALPPTTENFAANLQPIDLAAPMKLPTLARLESLLMIPPAVKSVTPSLTPEFSPLFVTAPFAATTPLETDSPILPSDPLITQATIPITKIEVLGNTALKPAEIEAILAPLLGRTVSRDELQKAITTINELYLKRGFITSRVVLDEASVASGNLKLQSLEGSIESIQVEGNKRLRTSYILSRLRRGAKAPLNVNALETELRYLRSNPIFEKVESSLKAGTKPGQSILTVRVVEAKRFGFDFGVDNYIPPSVAPDRAFAALSYRNLSGIGDQIGFSYAAGLNFGTLEHAGNYLAFNYRVPVNSLDGTVELQANYQKDRITEADLDLLGIEGTSQFYQITFRQPIIRQLNQELALSLGFSAQGGQTFLFNDIGTPFGFGPDADGVSRTRVLRFGQEYARRDGSGVWSARSQFNFGMGILDATENEAPIPDGRFFSWTGQVQRLQSLGKQNLLVFSGNFQLTPNSLLPSEQFVIGGNQTVRGYPQSARSGDMGYRFGIEGRFPILREKPLAYSLQLLPFAEVGQVFNLGNNPNQIPGPSLLGTIGLGFMWQPIKDVGLRLDYGIPLVDLGQDRNRSLQDRGLNFSLKVGFLF